MRDELYRWAWFGLAILGLVGFALMDRYEPIALPGAGAIPDAPGDPMAVFGPGFEGSRVLIWDRWKQELCDPETHSCSSVR